MVLQFTGGKEGWATTIGHVRLWLADKDSAPNAEQVAIAERIAECLPVLETNAANYLDMFVDRARACGDGKEHWWLDEIDCREDRQDGPTTFSLYFSLHGDDGGLWTVDMRASNDGYRPFRLERLQG